MLIKRVNYKRNYVLDINFKQCNDILMIKLKLHRVCPWGKHGNQSLKVVPRRFEARSAVPRLVVWSLCTCGDKCIHTLHDRRKSVLRGL